MKLCIRLLFLGILMLNAACSDEAEGNFKIFTHSFDFNISEHGWQHGFSSYPATREDSIAYDLQYAYTSEPISGVNGKMSIMLSGQCKRDSLFMFIKKKISGLEANTDYALTFDVELTASAESSGLLYPGKYVYFKVGATAIEPKAVIEKDAFVMNIDKGFKRNDGEDMICIGNLDAPLTASGFGEVTLSNSTYNGEPFIVKSNSKGEVWLIAGSESAAAGHTTLFFNKVNVVFSASK